jgi:type I restriction enzyme R subunit
MTEFKQIIGRGTRLKPEYGKEYFTIMDFRNVTRLFADPEFDGDPIPPEPDEDDVDDDGGEDLPPDGGNPPDGSDGDPTDPPEPRRKYRVRGVEVTILNERVMFYDHDGKLITESLTDYSKKNIRGMFERLEDFLSAWNSQLRKDAIINELNERGVLLDALRELNGNKELDDFDLICHIAFDKKPLTKSERASGVRKRDFLTKYEGLARDLLSALLDKYAQSGFTSLEGTEILELEPFREMGSPLALTKVFGGKQKYLDALRELQQEIYSLAA